MPASVDPKEIAHFSAMASDWWNPHGKFKPLHRMNPVRLEYILARIRESGFGIQGLRILDIGCGGGLVAEPLARLGANVTGIDAAQKNIDVARAHAKESGLRIDYRCTTAEEMQEQFDVVLALEIIEHVTEAEAFAATCMQLVKPGGIAIFSTLNRTWKAWALAIVGAEYMLRWLPKGTHTWEKFLRPSELVRMLERGGGTLKDMCGMVMHPLTFEWRLEPKELSVNYLVTVTKNLSS